MLRFFLVLLAVLVAALGFIFSRPWFYVGAGVPFIGALGLIGRDLWTTYRRHQEHSTAPVRGNGQNDELEDLGIVEVRPQETVEGSPPSSVDGPDDGGRNRPADNPSRVGASDRAEEEAVEHTPTSDVAPPVPDRDAVASADSSGDESATGGEPDGTRQALQPLLASARRALEAHTVCLLVQEDLALEYRIEACASASPSARESGVFETRNPLLTASMTQNAVSIRSLDADRRTDLGYYEDPPAVLSQTAVAPVPHADESANVFLVVDVLGGVEIDGARARRVLEQYVETVAVLRSAPTDDESSGSSPSQTVSSAPSPRAEPPSHRPRREIIAEEMATADEQAGVLALALVHLNRAEAIARRGEEMVASTERLLRTRLERHAPERRIERFGELTFGVFLRSDVDAAQTWAVELQEAMREENGALEGGVSVGVAVRDIEASDPERLQANATEALREAYETGTCTIVA